MNRRLLAAALLCVTSTAALAQDVDLDVGEATTQVQVPGLSVQVRVSGAPAEAPPPMPTDARHRGPRPPPVQVVGVDTFTLGFELKPQETLRLLSPEGARADIWADDGSYLGGFDVPCEVAAKPGQFYRVVMSLGGALVFDRKVELRRYYRSNVSFRGGARGPGVVLTAPQPTFAMVDFPALVEAVQAEAFSDAKLDVVRTSQGGLTVDQLGQLVDLFSFSSEQVTVVEVCTPRLVDRQNAFKLYRHFTFEGDKQKVKALLTR